jgi:hypothetical protein
MSSSCFFCFEQSPLLKVKLAPLLDWNGDLVLSFYFNTGQHEDSLYQIRFFIFLVVTRSLPLERLSNDSRMNNIFVILGHTVRARKEKNSVVDCI